MRQSQMLAKCLDGPILRVAAIALEMTRSVVSVKFTLVGKFLTARRANIRGSSISAGSRRRDHVATARLVSASSAIADFNTNASSYAEPKRKADEEWELSFAMQE